MAALDGVIAYLVTDPDLPLQETIADFVSTFVRSHEGGRQ
jgi:hypothetical protein